MHLVDHRILVPVEDESWSRDVAQVLLTDLPALLFVDGLVGITPEEQMALIIVI